MSLQQLLTNVVVIASAGHGLVLGISSRQPAARAAELHAGTMGIMAHELRTPLATMSLIGDAVRAEAARMRDAGAEARKLARACNRWCAT
jgi:two-component system CAI-1 autoinducer sensor kinase/phosphatase CqsS